MKDLFKDILELDDVRGVILLSPKGDVVLKELLSSVSEESELQDVWPRLMELLGGVREADIVYKEGRLYIRKAEAGFLLVLTGVLAPMAKVRLSCDILLPSLKEMAKGKGVKSLFTKKIF